MGRGRIGFREGSASRCGIRPKGAHNRWWQGPGIAGCTSLLTPVTFHLRLVCPFLRSRVVVLIVVAAERDCLRCCSRVVLDSLRMRMKPAMFYFIFVLILKHYKHHRAAGVMTKWWLLLHSIPHAGGQIECQARAQPVKAVTSRRNHGGGLLRGTFAAVYCLCFFLPPSWSERRHTTPSSSSFFCHWSQISQSLCDVKIYNTLLSVSWVVSPEQLKWLQNSKSLVECFAETISLSFSSPDVHMDPGSKAKAIKRAKNNFVLFVLLVFIQSNIVCVWEREDYGFSRHVRVCVWEKERRNEEDALINFWDSPGGGCERLLRCIT